MRRENLAAFVIVFALGSGAELMALQKPELSGTRTFTPPADGHLTDAQVRMYIAVRRAATAPQDDVSASAEPQAAIEQIARGSAVELSAARRLGVDADEYRWVRGRIIEASAPAAKAADAALLGTIEGQARAGAARVQNETGAGSDIVRPVDPAAIAWNREFLAKYRAELGTLSKRGR